MHSLIRKGLSIGQWNKVRFHKMDALSATKKVESVYFFLEIIRNENES